MFGFRKFEIGNSESNYTLIIGNYSGTAGNSVSVKQKTALLLLYTIYFYLCYDKFIH